MFRDSYDYLFLCTFPRIARVNEENVIMQELVLRVEDVSLEFGDKHLFDIERLTVYQHDRIGIIGDNGEGKSSLLKLILGETEISRGFVQKEIDFSYFSQLPKEVTELFFIEEELLSRLNVPRRDIHLMSGGESAKYRLAQTLSTYQEGLVLDEPTTHLDKKSRHFLMEELRYYYGTLLFVSHDREFLNKLATKIWEISDGQVIEYNGNYDDYKKQKEIRQIEEERAYSNYQQEKKKLERSIQKKRIEAQNVGKVTHAQSKKNIKPSRLSASKSKDTVQKNLFKQVKNLENRLNNLDSKSIFQDHQHVVFPKHHFDDLHNPYPIMANDLNITLTDKTILEQTDFQFKKGSKIAVVGENGVGKTTLLNYILEQKEGIKISSKVKFATYEQLGYQLNDSQPVLSFLMSQTDYGESVARRVLNQLGFTQSELFKEVKILSGGEKTRLSLAVTMTKPSNILILDEPTNFIDLRTIEALEQLIKSYQGTVIFTSHDSYFIKEVADELYELRDKKLFRIS